jgi:hypothetical protein
MSACALNISNVAQARLSDYSVLFCTCASSSKPLSRIKSASSHGGHITFLTTLAAKWVSVFVLASLAGHRHIATNQKHITVNDDVKRSAVEWV